MVFGPLWAAMVVLLQRFGPIIQRGLGLPDDAAHVNRKRLKEREIMSTDTSTTLRSFSAGRWVGRERAQTLSSAVTGAPIFFTHGESIDFDEMLDFGRRTGVSGLLGLDFQQRATVLRALAK